MRIESRETPSGLKMDAGSSPDVSVAQGPVFPRRQGKDDGSLDTNSLKLYYYDDDDVDDEDDDDDDYNDDYDVDYDVDQMMVVVVVVVVEMMMLFRRFKSMGSRCDSTLCVS